VVLNPSENLGAIRECTARNVPTIGIVDSDMDPRIVTYAIPANMESVRTAELITGTLSIAGQEGRRMRLRDEAKRQQRQQRDREWRSKSE
jgi:small subunit ribosomal protein S2